MLRKQIKSIKEIIAGKLSDDRTLQLRAYVFLCIETNPGVSISKIPRNSYLSGFKNIDAFELADILNDLLFSNAIYVSFDARATYIRIENQLRPGEAFLVDCCLRVNPSFPKE